MEVGRPWIIGQISCSKRPPKKEPNSPPLKGKPTPLPLLLEELLEELLDELLEELLEEPPASVLKTELKKKPLLPPLLLLPLMRGLSGASVVVVVVVVKICGAGLDVVRALFTCQNGLLNKKPEHCEPIRMMDRATNSTFML